MKKANLQEKYQKEVVPAFKKEFKVKNDLEVPRITRIIINTGTGSISEKDTQKKVVDELAKIAGQKPVPTLAKKAISGFKVRQGMNVGLKVTLRGKRMWEFLERLITAALPRIKDFQGIPTKNFSEKGDCCLGIKEYEVFPEINPDEVDYSFGLQVCIGIEGAKKKEESIFILSELGFPVQKK